MEKNEIKKQNEKTKLQLINAIYKASEVFEKNGICDCKFVVEQEGKPNLEFTRGEAIHAVNTLAAHPTKPFTGDFHYERGAHCNYIVDRTKPCGFVFLVMPGAPVR